MARIFLPADPLTGTALIDGTGAQFDRVLDNAHFWGTVTSAGSEGDTVSVDVNDNAVSPAQDTYFLSDGWRNGMGIRLVWPAANTGAVTVAVNGGTAFPVLTSEGIALLAGQLLAGMLVQLTYYDADFYCTSHIDEGTSGPAARYHETFNLSGTWTKPTGLGDDTPVFVRLWGAGGPGGTNRGGGGGAYAEAVYRLVDLPSSVSVTVGTSPAAGSGSPGGNTTFGSLLTAYGGGGDGGSAGFGGGAFEAGGNGTAGGGGGGGFGADATTTWGGGGGGTNGGRGINGGGGGGSTNGGLSVNGGNGGGSGAPGSAPGGGGGTNSVGGAGRCIVII